MEEHSEEDLNDFSVIACNLLNLFGDVISEDVIYAVVESCDGDLNLSADMIMNIINDSSANANTEDQNDKGDNIPEAATTTIEQNQPTGSYALVTQCIAEHTAQRTTQSTAPSTSQSTGAIPKQVQKPPSVQNFWTAQIREIISNHNQGNRLLILMRGAPGSGKSYLAKQLVEMMIGATYKDYTTHVFSTDDFFMVRGQYQFNRYKLSDAHSWNRNRVNIAVRQGLSPIIVDNTNIELWEMEPYVKNGVANGYIIEVLEPSTPWARKAGQLCRRNIHNVPIASIRRMLDNFRDGITGDILRRSLGLSYPADMTAPVKRLIPPVSEQQKLNTNESARGSVVEGNVKTGNTLPSTNTSFTEPEVGVLVNLNDDENERISEQPIDTSLSRHHETVQSLRKDNLPNYEDRDVLGHEEELKQKLVIEAQKKLEEMEKVEQEWENGETWDEVNQREALFKSDNSNKEQTKLCLEPKPPRNCIAELDQQSAKSLMLSDNDCQDWSQISMFMPSWTDIKPSVDTPEHVPVLTTSSSTCMEIGDTDVYSGKNKVVSAVARDINEFYMALLREKIPVKRMLDKSSMTNNQDILMENHRCKNEEKHFITFRKLFKNVGRSDLRDIFDKCHGDVNWAVDIVLDGMVNKQLKTVDTEEQSDPEDHSMEACECLAAYNIIPDLANRGSAVKTVTSVTQETCVDITPQNQKKSKKDINVSDESMQIKRQIEQNFVIADNHYSQHCLKIRKLRRGEVDNSPESPSTSATPDTATAVDSADVTNSYNSDDEESNASAIENEKIVTINLGFGLVAELDKHYGRADMVYPDYIVPKISLPLSVLNEVNALWMESLMYQIEGQAKQSAIMLQQDEEFARALAIKEAELLQEGKEPAVPDFKEIMDMDAAIALYQKDVAEWRKNIPKDMAAKMTREKLFNLFPDIEDDTLSELLMAHDNNFQSTVEVLLMSTGQTDILETENGVNKFVMEKELERQEKILEEQRQALSEVEWPLLPQGEVVEMSTVQSYRDEAEQHLLRRTLNYNKAQDYIRRGMTQVASYYSDIAAYHKQKFEQANSMAAASLMQVHATNSSDSATIDLHYLRVNEAKEAMDLFIDTHIQKLKDSQSKGGPRVNTLFFITGRGLHSPGRPRVKPAVRKRLRERGLGCSERNPGLLTAKVSSDDKLSYQIQVP